MNIGQIIHFHDALFFDGAVQLGWLQGRTTQAQHAAEAFVFHGPRYHGAAQADKEGIEGGYRLKDTASFVHDLLCSMHRSSQGQEENPYWLVVAGYGAGKSHLALTCASLLADPKSKTSQTILDQITKADAAIGEAVAQQIAHRTKPALVLPLDGMAGFHLGNALSRAVFAQLKIHGVDAQAIRDLSPRFQTAHQFVERNFAVRATQFERALPGLSAPVIQARLGQNDEEVYSGVDAVYTEANGHPIPIIGQESAQELINTLCTEYCGPQGPFSNVVIFFDELGRYLEYAAEKPQLAGDAALQQIFQGVQDNSAKVRFVGFIQYELKAYLKRFSGVDLRQLQRYITRFDAADKWYLSSNLETIFAHLIGKKDPAALSALWAKTGAEHRNKQAWQRLSSTLPGFERFPVWRDYAQFERVIAQGCWPLHPLAVWFLTRQRDLVQSRSALTFIKDLIERVSPQQAETDGQLRQVSAADLVIEKMLPEMLAAERDSGGAIAETLHTLLEKFSANLSDPQKRVLAGVAVLEKMRIGKQAKSMADALLCDASGLQSETLPPVLLALSSELGALEWNDDLGHYELLSDGATRGQFQQLLRQKQTEIAASGIRDLFITRAAVDCELGPIQCDFAQSANITTPEWFFQEQFSHINTVQKHIENAFQEWEQASLPKEAKGKVIYLYLHQDDDLEEASHCVRTSLDNALFKRGLAQAPIWVIGLHDYKGSLADHIYRLYFLTEKMSMSDKERFRRFISDEQDKSRSSLKLMTQEALKKQVFWIAGFDASPHGRFQKIAQQIFEKIYPKTVPFPFDGFGSAAGAGPADAAYLTRNLISKHVNGEWLQTQQIRIKNRIAALLVESWKTLRRSGGDLSEPLEPRVKAVIGLLEDLHKTNQKHRFLDSYQLLIAPPYGLNASSASVILGLFLGLDNPPRRIETEGQLVSAGAWIEELFPKQGKHYPDENTLKRSTLRFLEADSASRWKKFLHNWDSEENYEKKINIAIEAQELRRADPLPENFEEKYQRLFNSFEEHKKIISDFNSKIKKLNGKIEFAHKKENVELSIEVAGQTLSLLSEIEANSRSWSESHYRECEAIFKFAREVIQKNINAWIPRQSCESAQMVPDFRRKTDSQKKTLKALGFVNEAEALSQQALRCIQTTEARQELSMTLAECKDYPRQPDPQGSTPVRDLTDNIKKGDDLINSLQKAKHILSKEEIAAHTKEIQKRQEKLNAARKKQKETLANLYNLQLRTESALQEAQTHAKQLQPVFAGTCDESEVNDILKQLDRILSDIAALESGNFSVERLEELLSDQVQSQLIALKNYLDNDNIEPAWDMEKIYISIVQERIGLAKQHSEEWIKPRLKRKTQINTLDKKECLILERELKEAPSFLSNADQKTADDLLALIKNRLSDLNERDRQAQLSDWKITFPTVENIKKLDAHATKTLLRQVENPPCELQKEEVSDILPIKMALMAHLDRLNLDELLSRIDSLDEAHKREIHAHLSRLLCL